MLLAGPLPRSVNLTNHRHRYDLAKAISPPVKMWFIYEDRQMRDTILPKVINVHDREGFQRYVGIPILQNKVTANSKPLTGSTFPISWAQHSSPHSSLTVSSPYWLMRFLRNNRQSRLLTSAICAPSSSTIIPRTPLGESSKGKTLP